MKTTFILMLSVLFAWCFYACDPGEGGGFRPEFSPDHVVTDYSPQSITLKSKTKKGWDFWDFRINGKSLPFPYDKASAPDNLRIFDSEGREVSPPLHKATLFISNWFTIKKIDNSTLHIELTKAVEDREVSFDLGENGNTFQEIVIAQKQKK